MRDVMKVSIVPCCPVHESLILSGQIETIHYCAFCIRNQRDEIQNTLETVEREVALVYCEITGGKISKCNTDAQIVIAAANDYAAEEAKKEEGNKARDFLKCAWPWSPL